MAYEKFFLDSKSKFNDGIMLQEYNGSWFLVSARKPENGNGTVYKQYGFKQDKDKQWLTRDDGTPRPFPWSVKIGADKDQAINFMTLLLRVLKEHQEPYND